MSTWDDCKRGLDSLNEIRKNWSPSTKEEQEWVSAKIALLIREGKDRNQAVAIASSMAEEMFAKHESHDQSTHGNRGGSAGRDGGSDSGVPPRNPERHAARTKEAERYISSLKSPEEKTYAHAYLDAYQKLPYDGIRRIESNVINRFTEEGGENASEKNAAAEKYVNSLQGNSRAYARAYLGAYRKLQHDQMGRIQSSIINRFTEEGDPYEKGGSGSGNFGHAGRPGERGGSAADAGGGGAGESAQEGGGSGSEQGATTTKPQNSAEFSASLRALKIGDTLKIPGLKSGEHVLRGYTATRIKDAGGTRMFRVLDNVGRFAWNLSFGRIAGAVRDPEGSSEAK